MTEAGALLRAARERGGIDIAALAATLKVPVARLQALEAGRYDELPDATFTRALAQSVCRTLRIDPAPVLAQLPQPPDIGLEKVSAGLNTPFRDRPGSVVPAEWTPWRKPALWAAGVLGLGAAVFLLMPPRGIAPALDGLRPSDAAASPPSVLVAPPGAAGLGAAAAVRATPVPAAASGVAPATSTEQATPSLSGGAAADTQLTAVQSSWVQASDGSGQVVLSRLVSAGETIDLAGASPLRLKIGNAAGTRLVHRGLMVDLEPFTRDNVANVELR